MHPVVHKWIYHYCYDEIRKAMGRTVTILLGKTLEGFLNYDKGDALNRVIPHIKTRLQSIFEEEQTQVRDSEENDKLKNECARDIAYALAKEKLRKRYEVSEELDKLRKDAEEQFQIFEDSGRPYDHKTLQLAQTLFPVYLKQYKPENAIKLVEQLVEGFQKSPDSGSKLEAMQILGELYLQQGMISKATKIIAEVERIYKSRSLSIDLLKLDFIFF